METSGTKKINWYVKRKMKNIELPADVQKKEILLDLAHSVTETMIIFAISTY